jgi:hypothetical protein
MQTYFGVPNRVADGLLLLFGEKLGISQSLYYKTIERGWRGLKSGLEVRPIRHRLERRIEAHLQLCELAYLLQRVIELRIREKGHEFTGPRAIDESGTVVLNEIELATTGRRRRVVTDQTARQKALLEAIGVAEAPFAKGPRTLDRWSVGHLLGGEVTSTGRRSRWPFPRRAEARDVVQLLRDDSWALLGIG